MLGFEPITGMTPAGSPLAVATGLIFICEGGVYEIEGSIAFRLDRTMFLDGGIYEVDGAGSVIGRHRTFSADGGVYEVDGGDARIYKSSFFYGDPEVIRKPAEISAMSKPAEPREMVSLSGVVDSLVDEDTEDALAPRLRRT